MEYLFQSLYELQSQLKDVLEQELYHINNGMDICDLDTLEANIYRQYFNAVTSNFSTHILSMVDERIGYGRFLDKEYLDTLKAIVEEQNMQL